MRAGCLGTADRVVNNRCGTVVRALCEGEAGVVIVAAGAAAGAIGCVSPDPAGTGVLGSIIDVISGCVSAAGSVSGCFRFHLFTCIGVVRRALHVPDVCFAVVARHAIADFQWYFVPRNLGFAELGSVCVDG